MNYGQYSQMVLRSDATDKPYAFISYKHGDSPKECYTFLGVMRRNGYRYWYDESIQILEKWDERLQSANGGSSVLIALITENYLKSYQCLCELRQAIKQNRPIVLVSLDTTPLYITDTITAFDGKGRSEQITAAEWADITARQHLMLDGLVSDEGVFQESELRHHLKGASNAEPAFAAIRQTPSASDCKLDIFRVADFEESVQVDVLRMPVGSINAKMGVS